MQKKKSIYLTCFLVDLKEVVQAKSLNRFLLSWGHICIQKYSVFYHAKRIHGTIFNKCIYKNILLGKEPPH